MHCDADVIVVGAGPSGVLVAEQVARAGQSVLILEAGPIGAQPYCDGEGIRPDNAALFDIDPNLWSFATQGPDWEWRRVRAAGGRSLLWGGWCVRPGEHNFSDARAFGARWPFEVDDLLHHCRRVEKLLNVCDAPIDPVFEPIADRLGLRLAPKRGSVGPCLCCATFATDLLDRARLRTGCIALRLELDRHGRARGVEAMDLTTGWLTSFRARTVVLCASPVETARILLETPCDALRGPIGEGLCDHMIASAIVLRDRPPPSPGRPRPLERAVTVPRFVNLGHRARRDYRGGFSLEVRGPVGLETLDPAWLAALGIGAAHAPDASHFQIHAIGEACPLPSRRVTLDPARRDTLGRPSPRMHWAWTDEDRRMARDMKDSVIAIADVLAGPSDRVVFVRDAVNVPGAGHEAGTARMGHRTSTSVTRIDGSVRGVPGLYVADGSLMPTALDKPPTLTLLALALSVADGIVASARGR